MPEVGSVTCFFSFFFFQAEDGIRDHCVTGVQTCALPISERLSTDLTSLNAAEDRLAVIVDMTVGADGTVAGGEIYRARVRNHRSEERRVGKECRARWSGEHGKNKKTTTNILPALTMREEK